MADKEGHLPAADSCQNLKDSIVGVTGKSDNCTQTI